MIGTATIAAAGAAIGVVFGFVANRSNFCTMGAVADIVNMGSTTRMRMWMAALGVAVLAVAALQAAGMIDVTPSLYTAKRLRWLSHLVGGALFGVGMTLAGGCANKQLLRMGSGNLRALLVFFALALAASMTMTGLLALPRANVLDAAALDLAAPTQQLPQVLAGLGVNGSVARAAALLLFGVLPLAWALSGAGGTGFRKALPLGSAVALGLLVAAGWWVTAHLGFVPEHPETLEPAWIGTLGNRPESLSYVAPYAQTVQLLTLWTDAKSFVSFSVASMWGVVLGALLDAKLRGAFKLEVFRDPADVGRHLLGAVLMGFGGVTGLGCTIGQGITGMSTLAIGSALTLAGIVAGSAAMVKIEYLRA